MCPVWYHCIHLALPSWPHMLDALSKLSSYSVISCHKNMHHFCHVWQLEKHARLPFSSSASRTTKPFDLVHCDLWTSSIISVSSSKYYLIIFDDFSHYLWTFRLRMKSDTFTTCPIFCLSLLSSTVQFGVSSATTGRNSTKHPHGLFYSPTTSCYVCHAHKLPHKMVKLSALSTPSIMLFAPCFSKW
jgi:hypothetical protein